MLNFLLRKTCYRKFCKETQDFLLEYRKDILINNFVIWLLMSLLIIYPVALLMAIIAFLFPFKETIGNLDYSQLIILVIIYIVVITIFLIKYKNLVIEFIEVVVSQRYFKKYTRNGEAITREDFKELVEKDFNLFNIISRQKCTGFCYSVCFEILKNMQKGRIMFVTLKDCKDLNMLEEEYIMHVLYVNNNWCFDTYSCKQYELETMLKLNQSKVYKTFTYEDIKELDYETFKSSIYEDISKWCKENDCYHGLRG